MSDNLILENGRVPYAMLQGLELPWWAGMKRDGVLMQPGIFNPGCTREEMLAAACMNYEVIGVTPHYTAPTGTDGAPVLMQAKDWQAIIRTDNGAVLGMMSAGYKIHTMHEILDTFDRLCESQYGGGWKIIGLMALRGGRTIVAQCERDEVAEPVPGDRIAHRLMLQTSFDGVNATGATDSETRVVCDNTRSIAWNDQNARKATQRHRSKLDGDKLIQKIGIGTGSEAFARSMEQLRRLADVQCSDGQARDLLRTILESNDSKKQAKAKPVQAPPTGTSDDLASLLSKPLQAATLDISTAREHRNVQPILHLFEGAGQGATMDGVKGTRYGLLQAVTQFVDHHAGREWDTGKTSAYFGQGAALKARAFEVIAAGTAAEMVNA